MGFSVGFGVRWMGMGMGMGIGWVGGLEVVWGFEGWVDGCECECEDVLIVMFIVQI